MLLLTLRGTPTLYYGDELGMTDVPIPPERVQDPYERNSPGLGVGRDPARTPMQWSAGPGGGFTDAEPWLPLGDLTTNVEAQREDPRSMLSLHRELLALRREFATGEYRTVHVDDATFAYLRGETTLVALNLSGAPRVVPARGRVRLSTYLDGRDDEVDGELRLRPAEGVVLALG